MLNRYAHLIFGLLISTPISAKVTITNKDRTFVEGIQRQTKNVQTLVRNQAQGMLTLVRNSPENKNRGLDDSISQAMVDAYKTNPQIKAQRAAVRALDEGIVQAKAGWRPTINGTLSAGIGRNNYSGDTIDETINRQQTATTASRNNFLSAGVELRQNLFTGGGTVYQTREAKSRVMAARAALADEEQAVLLQACQAYLDLMTNIAELELLKQNEETLRKTLEATVQKYDIGEETLTSKAQAEGRYADAKARRQSAEATLDGSRATFERITFRKPGSLSKPTLPSGIPTSLDEVLERTRLNFPKIIQAMNDETAARHAVDVRESELLPKLDLIGNSNARRDRNKNRLQGTQFEFNKNPLNDRTWGHSLQVQLTVPLYEAGLTRSQRRQAAETAEQARIGIERIRRESMEQAIQAWNLYKSAHANLEFYRTQVRANQVSLDGTREELNVGSKILLDVLNAINQLVESQRALVQAERDYYLAAYQLLYFMGELTARGQKLKVDYYDPKTHYNATKNRI